MKNRRARIRILITRATPANPSCLRDYIRSWHSRERQRWAEEVAHAFASDGVRCEPFPGRRGRGARVSDMLRRAWRSRSGKTRVWSEERVARKDPSPRPFLHHTLTFIRSARFCAKSLIEFEKRGVF